MIRKRIAIFFVLFATTLLLAHAFVPHHHHKDHICLQSHHCPSGHSAHQHESPVNNHPHDHRDDSEFCVLKQAVFIPSHQHHFDKYLPGIDKPLSFLGFQALVSDNEWKSSVPGIVLSGHEYPAPSLHYQFSVSHALRAPPVF